MGLCQFGGDLETAPEECGAISAIVGAGTLPALSAHKTHASVAKCAGHGPAPTKNLVPQRRTAPHSQRLSAG